ncbi:MAG: YdcF family protein [Pseudomonadota bacterium]|uniref:YdcF family protein n=1 Tax=Fodinicurvata fenggangensis TaxID=1121830 RepID=UPI000556EBB6|nr:YdcF family protein [Fodinicurvata fenggangensis]
MTVTSASRRKRRGRLLLLLPALLLATFIFGLARFASNIPTQSDKPGEPVDAVVVWTGGSGRLDQGLKLLEEGQAERLFVSGVYHGVEVDELLEVAARNPDELRCCIELGYAAGNTRENAQETAAWASHNDLRSLRLVTAAYHMPRSLLEMRRAIPDVEILAEPVFPDAFRQEDWRWRARSLALLVNEYAKYLIASLRRPLPLNDDTGPEEALP